MLFNLNYEYKVNIEFNIDHDILIDEITKADLLENFIVNNCEYLHFRDLNDTKCIAKIITYQINGENLSIECDVYVGSIREKNYKRGKYDKVWYAETKKLRLVNSLGINQAQIAHSTDIFSEEYIPIEVYLKGKLPPIFELKLYELMLDGNYHAFRHKNLFSEYRDEISDFEKITYILKDKEGDIYFLAHKLDNDILSYKHEGLSLQRRKDARNLAKTIYQMTNGFTKIELINLLKNKNVFVKVTTTIDRLDKRAYNEISIAQMNEYTLSRSFKEYNRERKKAKTRYYQPQRLVKKQRRYIKRRQIRDGLADYYHEHD